MPSTQEKRSFQPVPGPDRDGAGEPSGELAPPPGILDRVPDEIRRKLPDDVVDELLAGARSEEEIVGARRIVESVDKPAGGAGAGGRAD